MPGLAKTDDGNRNNEARVPVARVWGLDSSAEVTPDVRLLIRRNAFIAFLPFAMW